jgi:hypothetical protein
VNTNGFILKFFTYSMPLLIRALLMTTPLVLCGCGGSSNSNASAIDNTNQGSNLNIPDSGSVSVGAVSSPLPSGWWQGAFMQVYVRAYQDSNGDGIGDLNGLIQRLDYLQDLGVKGLWLLLIMLWEFNLADPFQE